MPAGEGRNRKLTSEIANGRLAMMAIIGMFFQDGLTGSAWGDWALYTDSPLRAFENETGGRAGPDGFLGPSWLHLRRERGEFRAPPADGAQARSRVHAGHHGLHHPR
eukprot:259528-Pyramimonas_sp.AAC.1